MYHPSFFILKIHKTKKPIQDRVHQVKKKKVRKIHSCNSLWWSQEQVIEILGEQRSRSNKTSARRIL